MPPGSPLAPLTTHTERDCVTPLRATVCHYTGVFCVPLNLLIAAASILAFVRDPDSDTMSGNSFINAGNISIVVGCIGSRLFPCSGIASSVCSTSSLASTCTEQQISFARNCSAISTLRSLGISHSLT